MGELGFDPDKNTSKLILVSIESQFGSNLSNNLQMGEKCQCFKHVLSGI